MPGMSKTDNMLRWGFIRKVYGIVSLQLILTAIVAGIIYAVPPVRGFVTASLAFQLTFAILPLVGDTLRLSRQSGAQALLAHCGQHTSAANFPKVGPVHASPCV